MQRAWHPECPSPGGVDTNLTGQRDKMTPVCFRHLLMPLSAGYWPLFGLLFLAWSTILPLLLLQVNKINNLCKVTKNLFNHQSIFLISHSAFIYFFMCLFFHFTSLHWALNPASASNLGKILTHAILPTAFQGRDCSPFLTAPQTHSSLP